MYLASLYLCVRDPLTSQVRDTAGLGSSRLCAEVGLASPPPPCGVSDGGADMILCCVRWWGIGADMGVMRLRVEAAVGSPLCRLAPSTVCSMAQFIYSSLQEVYKLLNQTKHDENYLESG